MLIQVSETAKAMETTAQCPDWDMSPFFSALGGEDYAAFWQALIRDVDELRERTDGLPALDSDSSEEWIELLLAFEAAAARFGHLRSYLGCMCAADTSNEENQREEGKLATLAASLEKGVVVLQAALRDADAAAFDALLREERLAGIGYFLSRMRQRAAETMPAELEALNADLSVDGIGAWGRLYNRLTGNLRFELSVEGRESETLPVSMARSLLEDPDPAVRSATLAGTACAFEGVADAVAACLNAISGTRLTLYGRRGIEHFLDPALFDAGIQRATLDTMWNVVRQRQDVARSYLRHKASLLGKERLGFQDLMAPLPGDSQRLPWDQAKSRVHRAFRASYPALADFAAHAFERRWIDYQPRHGKRPGGFCNSSHVIGESRVFMTYNGATGDVQTLAHELGHGFHNWLMRDMRTWARQYPMPLAETASTFAEQLVTDAALADPETRDEERAVILDMQLQDAEVFLLNIAMRFDFEEELYERRAGGELGVSQLKEMMLESQRRNYGDALAPDQLDPWFWASKLHFYITSVSFYNFPYTFGYLFSLGIFARAKEEGPEFVPQYEALLRASGSAPAEEIARDVLGVDLQQPDFWNDSIDLIAANLGRFEEVTHGRDRRTGPT